MTENETIIDNLDNKLRSFISLYEKVKLENNQLIHLNQELKSSIVAKENEIKDLQIKCEHLKLAKMVASGSEDVHEAKLKVNKMVREIDRCIALLNK